MKKELMSEWYAVLNGDQIDIHVTDYAAHRSLTIATNLRDKETADLMAKAPAYKQALEAISELGILGDGEKLDSVAYKMCLKADEALGLRGQCESSIK